MPCGCTESARYAQAHTIRDAYQSAATMAARCKESVRYTQHLYAAGLLAAPTTAHPTRQCAEACEPDAPCRA